MILETRFKLWTEVSDWVSMQSLSYLYLHYNLGKRNANITYFYQVMLV